MPTPQQIYEAIQAVHDEESFIQTLLVRTLGWRISENKRDVESITYGWSEEELRAQGISERLLDGTVLQIQPMVGNPWGIFILNFTNPDVFVTGRGMTGVLRSVLRGLVPSKRRNSNLPFFNQDNLLFICTFQFKHFHFAYFKSPLNASQRPPLASFGWMEGDTHIRTLCEFNLPLLSWRYDISEDEWIKSWSQAFAVEKVTKHFYQEYKGIFEDTERTIKKSHDWFIDSDLRIYTQTLFNRLLFLRFIERKGWLEFQGRKDYLRSLFSAGGINKASFYQSRLRPLFFEGMAVEGKQQSEAVGKVQFLNGGLFTEDERDQKIQDLPDALFAPILNSREGLFYRYNFTVEESTPLDVEVALDPEMLGKVFEELVTGRHATGSYYTPRPIVSFMCKEALKGYLGQIPGVEKFVDEHDPQDLNDPESILESLRQIKICDPACGSGAYLVGMMQELVALRRCLFATQHIDYLSDYERKLEIIQINLYGVDIDPLAVTIAKLRLWLSLAIEYQGEKLPPLPNLDFKIEAHDSIIGPSPQDMQIGTYETLIRQYQEKKSAHIREHGLQKQQLWDEAVELRRQIADWTHRTGAQGFDWALEFAEVWLDNGGFDVVLANPPYVRQELIRDLKPILQQLYPEVYMGTADLYCYFYARSLQLLRGGGMLVYISSNKWFRANYGQKLRKHIADTCRVSSITDFEDLPVFETAIAYPMIFVAQKGNPDGTPIFTQVKSLEPPYPDVLTIIREQGERLPTDALRGSDWRLSGGAATDRLRKMEKAGVPLGEYVNGQIYRGILTGLNEAFVISGETRAELIAKDRKSAEIIKPLAVGKDFKKWSISKADRWIILIKIGVNIQSYQAVFEHLKIWQKELEIRLDQGNNWWELRSCAYYSEFEKPKIIWGNMSLNPCFAYSVEPLYTIAPANIIPLPDLYLLGVLNSNSSRQFFNDISIQRGGKYLEFKPIYVKQLPIPDASSSDRAAIADLAQKCLDAKGVGCEAWEKEIDERVAALYGL